ncbi:MAG TPA: UDP-N-acetylglucosamine 2-epimerase (non-hydrolyzing) [Bacteroidales bacterium]|nr:UDP-N-acetylglucosamine 2-epimerase (non-hydrolyzing) [Bacteroidales bacterium]
MKKIVTVIGARPQFIKAAAVSRAIRAAGEIQECIVHTGQHFDNNMSSVFFEEMDIPEPDYHLEINSLSHGAMTGRMIEKIEEVLIREKPYMVIVYGDTNSTVAGALAAKKLHLKVAHVEAGLRSFNMDMPEEINRIVTDRISDVLFCPTDNAVKNLIREGFEHFSCQIKQVGDVMYDAALYYGAMSSHRSDIINRLNLIPGNYLVGTVHRQENTDNIHNLKSIIEALNSIHHQIPVILPLHPRTRKILAQNDIHPDFNIIDPVGYFDMVELLKNSCLVITDSGGMQKEAYFFNKYCITLRDETEWVELVDEGYNFLSGADKSKILSIFEKIRVNNRMMSGKPLYGNGDAATIIADYLISGS